MAIVRAVKTGNWSDTTVWDTGALPTSSDNVYSNTFTVTIDTSPTVLSISNAATTGVTAGGSFVPTDGITLTCTAANGVVSAAGACVNSSLSAGQSCLIVANCVGGPSNGNRGVAHSGSGTVNIVGNCTGGTAPGTTAGAYNSGGGVINITGTCTGGSNSSNYGAEAVSGTINVTGNAVGGSGSNCHGAFANGGSVSITGGVSGSVANSTAYGANNSSSGVLTHVGTVQASSLTAGIGPGSSAQVTTLTGPLLCFAPNDATAGVNPCIALRWFPADTALSTFRYEMRGQTASGSPAVRPARNLYLADAYASGYPSATDVRTGTTYGAGGSLTGTCAVPAAASVVVGAAVDATVGTAAITASTIRDAMGLASANLDAQLAAITSTAAPSVIAIRTELDTNSSKLANLDSTISSRLAASGYTTPPTAAATATATRSELATELARIDAAISSRLSPSGTLSRVTLTDTATTLTNAPEVPTAAAIASQVRTEISTELGRIDATISSRLPSVTYSSPLDASGTRNAIGLASANLDTQLARVANTATTQEVGDLISEALQ